MADPMYDKFFDLMNEEADKDPENMPTGEQVGRLLDAIWPEIEKYQKFVEGIIELGPDGVEGLIEYLGGGELIPFEPEAYNDHE